KRRVGGEPEVPMAVLGHRGARRQRLFPAEDGAHVAPLVSVLAKAGRVVARLTVHHQEIGAGRDLAVEGRELSDEADIGAARPTDLFGESVGRFPVFHRDGGVPPTPAAIDRIIEAGAGRHRTADIARPARLAEVAIAEWSARDPTVVGEGVNAVTLDHLPIYSVNVGLSERAIDAHDLAGPALRIARQP